MAVNPDSINKKNTKVVKGFRPPIVNERFLITVLKVIASNKELTRRTVNNIWKFLTMIDRTYYSRDYTIGAILQALDLIIDCRMDGTFDNGNDQYARDTVMNRIVNQMTPMYAEAKNNIIVPIVTSWDAKDKEVDMVDETISIYIKFATVVDRKETLSDIVTDLTSGSVMNLKKSIADLEDFIHTLSQDFRDLSSIGDTKEFVHITDEFFPDNYLREIFKRNKNPKANLKVGLKMFNSMLSTRGGFVSGKYYIIYADVNSFKSALLQHISRWIKMYNHDTYYQRMIESKKKPTVLHVNLENFLAEDAERFFKMFTEHSLGESSTFEDAKNRWFQGILAGPNAGSCIGITLVHRGAQEVSVSDIDNMIDTLGDDGYEVIAVVIDYLELIKPEDVDRNKETREKLAGISERLHSLAGRRDIPVITAQQINREGQRVLGEAKAKGQTDVIKLLNRSYVGEAMAIDKKTDFSMFIGLEKGRDGNVYLGVKRDKCRYTRSDIDYFVHEIKHGIVIEDDVLYGPDKVLSKVSLANVSSGDGMTFSGSDQSNVGSRGYTSLKKESPKMDMAPTKATSNWIKEIDDKPIDSMFLCGWELLKLIGPKPVEDMTMETIDGSNYYFDNIYLTPYGDAVEIND